MRQVVVHAFERLQQLSHFIARLHRDLAAQIACCHRVGHLQRRGDGAGDRARDAIRQRRRDGQRRQRHADQQGARVGIRGIGIVARRVGQGILQADLFSNQLLVDQQDGAQLAVQIGAAVVRRAAPDQFQQGFLPLRVARVGVVHLGHQRAFTVRIEHVRELAEIAGRRLARGQDGVRLLALVGRIGAEHHVAQGNGDVVDVGRYAVGELNLRHAVMHDMAGALVDLAQHGNAQAGDDDQHGADGAKAHGEAGADGQVG
ncbi:hypothetical protein D3C81_1361730 [compost metagenome]